MWKIPVAECPDFSPMLYVKKKNQNASTVGQWLKLLVTALIGIGISIIPYGLIVPLEVQWPKVQKAVTTRR
jgi:hypothetical protein